MEEFSRYERVMTWMTVGILVGNMVNSVFIAGKILRWY